MMMAEMKKTIMDGISMNMKKILYFAAIAAIVAGCAKDIEVIPDVVETKGTTVTFTANVDATRTVIDGSSFAWVEGEEISVGTSSGYVNFECIDEEEGVFSHTFPGEVPEFSVAVSPVQSGTFTNESNYQVTLPSTYTWTDGITNALMVGTLNGSGGFTFYHAASLLKVTYKNVPSSARKFVATVDGGNVSGTVTLSGVSTSEIEIANDKEGLDDNQSISISFSEGDITSPEMSFYVPLPTGTYTSLVIKLQDESSQDIEESVKTLNKNLVLTRRQVLDLPPIILPAADKQTIGTSTYDTEAWLASSKSEQFEIAKGKRLHLVFTNKNGNATADSGNNYYNWLLNMQNASDAYRFHLRADAYAFYDTTNLSDGISIMRYSNPNIDWAKFRKEMDNATVYLDVDFANNGNVYIYAKTVAANGAVYTMTYKSDRLNDQSTIKAQLMVDHSQIIISNVYLDKSRGDVEASTIELIDVPASAPACTYDRVYVVMNADPDIKAVVTYTDNSQSYVAIENLAFNTLVEGSNQTLEAWYGLSKYHTYYEGIKVGHGTAIISEVYANYVKSISAQVNAVVFGASDLVNLSAESFDVTATWADYSTSKLASTEYTVGSYSGSYWGATYVAQNKENITTITHHNTRGEDITDNADLYVEFKNINSTGFGSTSTDFAWNWQDPWEVKNGESGTIALTCVPKSDEFINEYCPQIYIKNGDQTKELYKARMDYGIFDIQDVWKWYGWGSQYVQSGNIEWSIYNAANLTKAKVYITVDNHDGYAWITYFWQYYTDTSYTDLIASNNTVFVNYGRLPITPGESIYIIPASQYCAVTFIK